MLSRRELFGRPLVIFLHLKNWAFLFYLLIYTCENKYIMAVWRHGQTAECLLEIKADFINHVSCIQCIHIYVHNSNTLLFVSHDFPLQKSLLRPSLHNLSSFPLIPFFKAVSTQLCATHTRLTGLYFPGSLLITWGGLKKKIYHFPIFWSESCFKWDIYNMRTQEWVSASHGAL